MRLGLANAARSRVLHHLGVMSVTGVPSEPYPIVSMRFLQYIWHSASSSNQSWRHSCTRLLTLISPITLLHVCVCVSRSEVYPFVRGVVTVVGDAQPPPQPAPTASVQPSCTPASPFRTAAGVAGVAAGTEPTAEPQLAGMQAAQPGQHESEHRTDAVVGGGLGVEGASGRAAPVAVPLPALKFGDGTTTAAVPAGVAASAPAASGGNAPLLIGAALMERTSQVLSPRNSGSRPQTPGGSRSERGRSSGGAGHAHGASACLFFRLFVCLFEPAGRLFEWGLVHVWKGLVARALLELAQQ